jgi:hypothetical protein
MRARVSAAAMECPYQACSKSATAGKNSYESFGADAFTSSAACGSRLTKRTEAAVRIAERHSLPVVV